MIVTGSNIEIFRGDDEPIAVQILSDGVPVNITGFTIFFTVKNTDDNDKTDDSAVIKKNVTTHTDPTAGITTIVLTDSDTDIPPTNYEYDIQWKDLADDIKTLIKARFCVKADTTRRIT